MNAVITAGGVIDGEYAALAGTRVKALAPVRGASLLERSIRAAYGAGAARVAVVGDDEVAAACGRSVDRIVAAVPDGSENLRRALGAWPEEEALLYLTSDLPYVTADAVRDLLVRRPADAISIPLTNAAAFVHRFPGAPPFGITLAGERVVNGGAFVLPAGAASRVGAAAARLFRARKSPWAMARALGPALIARLALGRLSIAALEAYAQRAAGVPAAAVRGCAPELAYDADDVDAYRYACRHA